jgi:hypothetical protein
LGIACVIAVGAVSTLLWTHRRSEPVTAPSPQPVVNEAAAPAEPFPSPEIQPELDNVPPTADAVAPPPPPPPSATAHVTSDNFTYDRMLAAAQARPQDASTAKDIAQWHETFMLAPDDPGWARGTEQALKTYFEKTYEGSNFEVTSVACRADRCEVQTLNRMPTFDGAAVVPPPSEDFDAEQRKIFNLTHAAQPLGDTGIRLENTVSAPVGDQIGSLLSYRRM